MHKATYDGCRMHTETASGKRRRKIAEREETSRSSVSTSNTDSGGHHEAAQAASWVSSVMADLFPRCQQMPLDRSPNGIYSIIRYNGRAALFSLMG